MLKKRPARKTASRVKKKISIKKSPAKKPARKKLRPLVRKKPVLPRKKPAAAKKDELGRVIAFFRIPVVAVIRVTRGGLRVGDRVWIKGHTTDLRQVITSMQVDHQPVLKILKGEEAGVKTSSRVRIGDRVYRIDT